MNSLDMPQVGQDLPTGKIIQWLIAEGEPVKKGDIVLEVESEKAAFEVESPHEGVPLRQLHPNGAEVDVFSLVGFIGAPGEDVPDTTADLPPVPEEGARSKTSSLRVIRASPHRRTCRTPTARSVRPRPPSASPRSAGSISLRWPVPVLAGASSSATSLARRRRLRGWPCRIGADAGQGPRGRSGRRVRPHASDHRRSPDAVAPDHPGLLGHHRSRHDDRAGGGSCATARAARRSPSTTSSSAPRPVRCAPSSR